MHEIIDNRVRKNDPLINNLFVQTEHRRPVVTPQPATTNGNVSEILSLKNGFGFIKYPPNNLFFHYSNVVDTDFNDLKIGDKVEFTMAKNQDGQDIAVR
jgi:cold shock CspA family protein